MEDCLTFAQTLCCAAQRLVVKFWKAFEVPSKSYRPAVECIQSEKAKLASMRRPINVEVDEFCKFVGRSEKRIIDLEPKRLTQARVITTLGTRASFADDRFQIGKPQWMF